MKDDYEPRPRLLRPRPLQYGLLSSCRQGASVLEAGAPRHTASSGIRDQDGECRVLPLHCSCYICRAQRLYVVGSTNDGKSCRVLKIDRTTSPTTGLAIEEDEKEYQQEEVCVCE